MRNETTELPPVEVKIGHIIYNCRWHRWGQVVHDARTVQFETGEPLTVIVFEFDRRGTMNWPLADVSVVVNPNRPLKGKVLWDCPDRSPRSPYPRPCYPPTAAEAKPKDIDHAE